MKKQLLFIAAIVISVGGAIASHAAKAGDPDLVWFDANGNYITTAPESGLDCQGSNLICAKGYASVSDPQNPTEPTTQEPLSVERKDQ